jgi:uncharacterized repeat protein (TIGR03803 family)
MKHFLLTIALGVAFSASRADAQTFQTLFAFSGSNGLAPEGSLTINGSTLYGTTYNGGSTFGNPNDYSGHGFGTVFSLPISGGTATTLFNFDGTHGANPQGNVLLSGATLYGLTVFGGSGYNSFSQGNGVVFSLPLTGGTSATLCSISPGAYPRGSLINIGSTLYGMTEYGGSGTNNGGTIFSLPMSGGTPTVLTSFTSTSGVQPYGSLILNGSNFYGMTSHEGGNGGAGTVFSLPVSGGTATVLNLFNSSAGGAGVFPMGDVTLSADKSTLYGMTSWDSADTGGDGKVFSLPIGGGTAAALVAFSGSTGNTLGANPQGSLLVNGSTLYGMTEFGGAFNDGVIFSVNTDGSGYKDLLDFDGTNGEYPFGDLILSGGTLFGTTAFGGPAYNGTAFSGYGTVFAFTLPTPEPGALALAGCGAAALLSYRWRRRRRMCAPKGRRLAQRRATPW